MTNTVYFALTKYSDGNKATRWHVNNVRVARDVFENLNYFANRKDSFATSIDDTGRVLQFSAVYVSAGIAANIWN